MLKLIVTFIVVVIFASLSFAQKEDADITWIGYTDNDLLTQSGDRLFLAGRYFAQSQNCTEKLPYTLAGYSARWVNSKYMGVSPVNMLIEFNTDTVIQGLTAETKGRKRTKEFVQAVLLQHGEPKSITSEGGRTYYDWSLSVVEEGRCQYSRMTVSRRKARFVSTLTGYLNKETGSCKCN